MTRVKGLEFRASTSEWLGTLPRGKVRLQFWDAGESRWRPHNVVGLVLPAAKAEAKLRECLQGAPLHYDAYRLVPVYSKPSPTQAIRPGTKPWKVLELLRDGQPHAFDEIAAFAGLTVNRLRKYTIYALRAAGKASDRPFRILLLDGGRLQYVAS